MELCESAFPGLSLYAILGLSATATSAEVKVRGESKVKGCRGDAARAPLSLRVAEAPRLPCDLATTTPLPPQKAYYKGALKYHPDKAGGDEGATRRFQALGVAHAVLSDPARRAAYDATGEVDDDGAGEGDSASAATWAAYWRAQFPAFSERDIDEFAGRYKGSAEEAEDVLAAYALCKGDMDEVLDHVPCADSAQAGAGSDVERFVAIVHAAIAAGTVKPLRAFTRLYGEGGGGEGGAKGRKRRGGDAAAAGATATARAQRAAGEAREAEEVLSNLRKEHSAKHGGAAGGSEPSLADMLRARGAARAAGGSDFLSSLEAKYGGAAGGGKGRAALEDAGPSAARGKRQR